MIIMNKIEKYIKKLEENRKLALEFITKSIDSNNTNICLNIDEVIISTLLKDDANDKKTNEALCNARELIKSLINEIRNAKTNEELVNVRNKLNYYLNKVKSIMKQKEVSEENITLYSNIVKELRNNIGEYLRLIKRNDYMLSIKELSSKENLSQEEEKQLENSYERERRFNTRLLKKYNPNYKKVVRNKTPKEEDVSETISVSGLDPALDSSSTTSLIKPKNIDVTENATSLLNPNSKVILKKDLTRDANLVPSSVEQGENKLKGMIEESKKASSERKQKELESIVEVDENGMVLVKNPYPAPVTGKFTFDIERQPVEKREFKSPEELLRVDFSRYNLSRVNPYGNGLVKDLGSLFKNIPIYLANKRSLKIMIRDFNCFCSSQTLSNLINFTIYENSFKKALKKVFSPRKEKDSIDYEMDSIREIIYDDSDDFESEVLSKRI